MKKKRKSNDDKRIDLKNRAEQKTVEQIAAILDKDKSVRTKVFRELHAKQRETIKALRFQDDTTQNASRLAFSPEKIDTSTAEAKAKALETIKAEINGLHTEIDQNKSAARKLMSNAVWYAKHIGDRLLFVKWHPLSSRNDLGKASAPKLPISPRSSRAWEVR